MKNKLCVALDVNTYDEAFILATVLKPYVGMFKVGMQLFTKEGPRIIKMLKDKEAKVFLDMKYHDIPNTVKQAVIAAADLGVDIINVHALGGYDMLRTAVVGLQQHCEQYGLTPPKLIGVTILTSTTEQTLRKDLMIDTPMAECIQNLTYLCLSAGLDGIVCSPHEVAQLRRIIGDRLFYITPGVRPLGADTHDQKRFMTPMEAILAGSDLLVVGRPITAHEDPAQAARDIVKTMEV